MMMVGRLMSAEPYRHGSKGFARRNADLDPTRQRGHASGDIGTAGVGEAVKLKLDIGGGWV